MRHVTRLKLEIWGIIAAVYGGCAVVAAFVCFRIWRAVDAGEITFGRHSHWLFHRAEEPFWFWFAVVWHAVVVLMALGVMAWFAREMDHLGLGRIGRSRR